MKLHGKHANSLADRDRITTLRTHHAFWHKADKRSITKIRGQGRCVVSPLISMAYYMGMDFGTSGARLTVIEDDGSTVFETKRAYAHAEQDWSSAWERLLWELLDSVPEKIRSEVVSVAFDGTSATSILVNQVDGKVLAPVKLYNEAQAEQAVQAVKAIAPASHTTSASTSTLCKLMAWHLEEVWQQAESHGMKPCLMHQADWLASLLHGSRSVSDWNNALKLGFDPETEAYPEWLNNQAFSHLLPSTVLAPGSPVAPLTAAAALRSGLPGSINGSSQPGCLVCAGTTDSIAAFVAAGVTEAGQAVTSLGSTLAIKMLSQTRVDDATYGVYSHRLGNSWLVGGASNTGGAVLRKFFADSELHSLTQKMDLSCPTGLDYYPLVKPGERFPINDPGLRPRLEPRPADNVVFLQGVLESMARIEGEAYKLLVQLGASPAVTEVLTAGGGAVNEMWTQLRAGAIGVPVSAAKHGDASYGAALLARQGWRSHCSAQTKKES
ncbi:hypothetical protein CEUSTIGMA_g10884.t1 [Chlamydomonas eustigma]|uniref:D-ribulose kinase n=1 Tax=Chlamydomonas eustigma TaxID=1157962 RepID=A0A250XKK1_9CHLO|nr:hypothetical protein CEUSTIGMA_g10884.t1 [Chlamydomonas eustigma]|eukprot:GAX83459.1 hypothetical protein CEUSTIGMA_g10884.t1 [Chlamydomonas eustigma]